MSDNREATTEYNTTPARLHGRAAILSNRLGNWFAAWKERIENRSEIQLADHKEAYYAIKKLICKYDLSKESENWPGSNSNTILIRKSVRVVVEREKSPIDPNFTFLATAPDLGISAIGADREEATVNLRNKLEKILEGNK